MATTLMTEETEHGYLTAQCASADLGESGSSESFDDLYDVAASVERYLAASAYDSDNGCYIDENGYYFYIDDEGNHCYINSDWEVTEAYAPTKNPYATGLYATPECEFQETENLHLCGTGESLVETGERQTNAETNTPKDYPLPNISDPDQHSRDISVPDQHSRDISVPDQHSRDISVPDQAIEEERPNKSLPSTQLVDECNVPEGASDPCIARDVNIGIAQENLKKPLSASTSPEKDAISSLKDTTTCFKTSLNAVSDKKRTSHKKEIITAQKLRRKPLKTICLRSRSPRQPKVAPNPFTQTSTHEVNPKEDLKFLPRPLPVTQSADETPILLQSNNTAVSYEAMRLFRNISEHSQHWVMSCAAVGKRKSQDAAAELAWALTMSGDQARKDCSHSHEISETLLKESEVQTIETLTSEVNLQNQIQEIEGEDDRLSKKFDLQMKTTQQAVDEIRKMTLDLEELADSMYDQVAQVLLVKARLLTLRHCKREQETIDCISKVRQMWFIEVYSSRHAMHEIFSTRHYSLSRLKQKRNLEARQSQLVRMCSQRYHYNIASTNYVDWVSETVF